jgi:hypothetical protein
LLGQIRVDCPRSVRTPEAVPCRGLCFIRDRRAAEPCRASVPAENVTAPIPWAATGSLCRECHGYATARKGKGHGARSRGRVLTLPVPACRWCPAVRSRLMSRASPMTIERPMFPPRAESKASISHLPAVKHSETGNPASDSLEAAESMSRREAIILRGRS